MWSCVFLKVSCFYCPNKADILNFLSLSQILQDFFVFKLKYHVQWAVSLPEQETSIETEQE